MTRYALAVDVGGTKMEAALVGEDGALVAGSRSRQATGRQATFESLTAAVQAIVAHALAALPDGAEVVGAGAGSAGPIDRVAGAIMPVNMPLAQGFGLAAAVREAASAGVGREVPSVLLMVGDGPERARTRDVAVELGVERYVKYLGQLDAVDRLVDLQRRTIGPGFGRANRPVHSRPWSLSKAGGTRSPPPRAARGTGSSLRPRSASSVTG